MRFILSILVAAFMTTNVVYAEPVGSTTSKTFDNVKKKIKIAKKKKKAQPNKSRNSKK